MTATRNHSRPNSTSSLESLREQLSKLDKLKFFFSSSNELISLHRSAFFSALFPFIYGVALTALQYHGFLGTLFTSQTSQFITGLAVCLSLSLVLRFLPRYKTYELWHTYMSSVRHNRHVHAVLHAYELQLTKGDAPQDDKDKTLSAETYKIWRSKLSGLSSTEVQTKYVNFCWRYIYRLWQNREKLAKNKPEPRPPETESSSETLNTSKVNSQEEPFVNIGDGPYNPESGKLRMDPVDLAKLEVLEQLAAKVGRFADALRANPDDLSNDLDAFKLL